MDHSSLRPIKIVRKESPDFIREDEGGRLEKKNLYKYPRYQYFSYSDLLFFI